MAYDTELNAVDKNLDEAVVSDCVFFASFLLSLVLRHFFSTLVGVITSATPGGNTKYLLMGFNV